VLAKHHLIPSSDHQNHPHILPHHGAVDSSAPDRAGKREGGLEVSKTPRRNAPGRKIRMRRNTHARSFMTSRPNLAMPRRGYTPIIWKIALHPAGSAADVSSKMGRGVIDA
jgi:hypothetical protein